MLLQEAIIQYSIVNCGSLTPYPRTLWRQPTLRSRQRPCYWGMEGGGRLNQFSIVNCGSLTPTPEPLALTNTTLEQSPQTMLLRGGANPILNSQLLILYPYPRTLWPLPPLSRQRACYWGRGEGANPILNSQLLVLYPHPRTLWTPPPLSPQRPFWGEGRILLDMVYVCPGGDCTGIAIFWNTLMNTPIYHDCLGHQEL